MNKVVIRVDASLEIGSGHVMRCLTLADVLKEQGAEVIFICRKFPGNLIWYIESKNYEVYTLESVANSNQFTAEEDGNIKHSHWLGVNQLDDAEQCRALLEKNNTEWLIVDHYGINYRWHSYLKKCYLKLMVIDDLADRVHECDLLLDQTYARKNADYKQLVPGRCKLILGVKYALLRPEFSEWREYSLKRREKASFKRLLITMGGVDSNNVTRQVLEALQICDLPNDAEIVVVMGRAAPHLESVKKLAETMSYRTVVRVDVNNMAERMANADIAIGAAGGTTWERFCLELPSIILALADNQFEAKEALKSLSIDLIDARDGGFDAEICEQLEIIKGPAKSPYLRGLIDGLGRNRVCRVMQDVLKYTIRLNCQKKVDEIVGLGELSLNFLAEENIEQVRIWRNSNRVLNSTISSEKITKHQQIKWFNGLRVNDYYFKILYRADFVGVASLKFNSNDNSYDPGVFIGEDQYEGLGIGISAALLLSLFGFECLGLKKISARILKDNRAAIRMNVQLGYVLYNEGEEFDEYVLDKKNFDLKKSKLIELVSRVV